MDFGRFLTVLAEASRVFSASVVDSGGEEVLTTLETTNYILLQHVARVYKCWVGIQHLLFEEIMNF